MLGGAAVTLLLQDSSNRIFVFLAAQMLFAVICLDGKKRVLAEVSFLTHFALLIADAVAQSVMIFILYDEVVLSAGQHVELDGITAGITILIILAIERMVPTVFRSELQSYIRQFNYRLFFYYLSCIITSSILMGCAAFMISEDVMIYRYKVTMLLAADVFCIMILVFAVLLNAFLVQRNRLREDDLIKQKYMEEQAAQYEMITYKNQELQRFRHDQKAYVLALKGMIQNGDLQRLRKYVDDVDQKIRGFDYIATGNLVGDAVFNAQAEMTEATGVHFQVTGRFPQKLRVSDADLASLLSNAVKNACEAATLCEEERSVEVWVRSYKQKLFLEIRNSAIAAPTAGDGHLATTKEDVENHGIGTRNMADIVEKYEGKLTWEYDGIDHVTTKIEI